MSLIKNDSINISPFLPTCHRQKTKNFINKSTLRILSILHRKAKEETSAYASFKKASYTIEATIIIPIFITLMVFGMFTFRLLQVQSGMQKSIDTASRTMAVSLGKVSNTGESDKDVNVDEEDPTVSGELSEAGLIASTIGLAAIEVTKNHVPLRYIDGGAAGIYFLDSTAEGNYIDLKVSYTMTFPVGLLGDFSFDVSQRARTRKWVGYDKSENTTDGTYVYITEHGEVYHTNYYCTYLNPSVHKISALEVSQKRNKSGAKYYECERCKNASSSGVLYITDYGTAYHKDINCTEIKHDIKRIKLDDVKDTMRPCSKCAAGEEH